MWSDKSVSFWTLMIGMTVWVFMSTSPTESLVRRLGKTFVSAALAFGLSTEVASYLSVGEGPAAVGIMAFGLIFLDTATAVASDRKLLTELIRGRLGAKPDVDK
jgi:hypothetical protein